MAKASLNLSVDESAIARGRRYSRLHNTSISELVGRFLAELPLEEEIDGDEQLTPTVRRLLGVAGAGDREEYHRYLLEKYGR